MTHQTPPDPENWVDEYGDYLYRYAWSRLRDSTAAEEVVQETFLAGVRHLNQFSGQGSERGWLLGILKRKIVDHVRMRQRYDRDGSLPENEHDPTTLLFDQNGHWKANALPNTPAENAEAQELWEVVRECIQHLPEGQAAVFVLSVMEDMDSDDICRELGITPNNLWVRLHRARLGLAQCVGARWFSSEEARGRA